MSDRVFMDSNIILYTLDKGEVKKKKSLELLRSKPIVSPQVIFECLNVAFKKFKMSKADALDFARFIIKYSTVEQETRDIVIDGLMLWDKYQLQVFDSKIVSSALHAGCSILYSEDMQHGLVIENRPTIINPFLPGSSTVA